MTVRAESRHARRLAIRLLDWYPKRWRARYAHEMRALLDEMPVAWRQVADLAIGAAREWLSPRASGWPARSAASRIQAARRYKFIAWAVAIELAVHALVLPLSAAGIAIPDLEAADRAVIIATLTRLFLGWLFRLSGGRFWRRRPSWFARLKVFGPLGTAEIVLWYAVMALHLTHQHVAPSSYVGNQRLHVLADHLSVLVWASMLLSSSARTKRLTRIATAHQKRVLSKPWMHYS
jgi:hypothetical protein